MELELFGLGITHGQLIFRCVVLSWWLAYFTPLQQFLDEKVKPKIPQRLMYLKIALSCHQCLSFWTTLIFGAIAYYEFVFFDAILAALIAFTYQKLMDSIKLRM
jgi:hypothetical protein